MKNGCLKLLWNRLISDVIFSLPEIARIPGYPGFSAVYSEIESKSGIATTLDSFSDFFLRGFHGQGALRQEWMRTS